MTFWSETSTSSPLADGAGSLLTETFLVNSNPAIGTWTTEAGAQRFGNTSSTPLVIGS